MTSETQTLPADSEWVDEDTMGKWRKKGPRALRAERQRGDGPPFVKDGRVVLYHAPGYGQWLKAQIRHPVRSARGA